MIDYLCDDCKEAFDELQDNLNALGIPFVIDPDIVRGLDYYTKTAFEFVTTKIGAQGTVCGGGRYDNLIEELGGPPIPGVGFGLGIERLLMLMDANESSFPEEDRVDVFIAVMGNDAKAFGLKLCRELRQKGLIAEMDILASFMESCLEIDYVNGTLMSAQDLFNLYSAWAKKNNEFEMTSRKFFNEVGKKLPEKTRKSNHKKKITALDWAYPILFSKKAVL